MTGRHARKPPMPFWALIAALVLAVGFVVVTLSGSGSGSPSAGGSDGSDASSTRPSSPTLAASPTAPTSTPEPKGTLVIHGAGDVSLDPSYISTYASQGYGYAWSGLGGLFRHDDLTS